jgi:hypothetical protein
MQSSSARRISHRTPVSSSSAFKQTRAQAAAADVALAAALVDGGYVHSLEHGGLSV